MPQPVTMTVDSDAWKEQVTGAATAAADTVGTRAVAATRWVLLAPLAARLIGLGATVVLARLLTPADFGLMAYAGTLLAFFSIFQDLGMTQTLIATPGDVSNRLLPAFTVSLLAGFVFYAVLLIAAFPCARFLGEPRLVPILAAMGLVVFLQTSAQVHHALLVRAAAYRTLCVVAVLQSVAYLVAAAACGFAGLGVWALVAGHLASHATRSSLLWARAGWRPAGLTAWRRLVPAELLRFGGALTAISVLDWSSQSFLYLALGKLQGAQSLGVYRLSFEGSRLAYFGLSALAGTVGLTSYASLLPSGEELRRLMLKGLRVANSFAYPVAAAIAALAPWIVPVVWGEQWLAATPLLSILALHALVAPMGSVVWPYLVSAGRLRPLLLYSTLNLAAYIGVGGLAARTGLWTVALAHTGLMLVSGGSLVGLGLWHAGLGVAGLRSAVLCPALAAAASGLAALAVARGLDGAPPWALLVPALATAGLVYAGSLYLTSRTGFFELLNVLARGTGWMRRGA